jgi:hypothetical protein
MTHPWDFFKIYLFIYFLILYSNTLPDVQAISACVTSFAHGVLGVVGGDNTTDTTTMQMVSKVVSVSIMISLFQPLSLTSHKAPVVSGSSISNIYSSKDDYPYVFRTITPVQYEVSSGDAIKYFFHNPILLQVPAIISVMQLFNWERAVIISSSDEYLYFCL